MPCEAATDIPDNVVVLAWLVECRQANHQPIDSALLPSKVQCLLSRSHPTPGFPVSHFGAAVSLVSQSCPSPIKCIQLLSPGACIIIIIIFVCQLHASEKSNYCAWMNHVEIAAQMHTCNLQLAPSQAATSSASHAETSSESRDKTLSIHNPCPRFPTPQSPKQIPDPPRCILPSMQSVLFSHNDELGCCHVMTKALHAI